MNNKISTFQQPTGEATWSEDRRLDWQRPALRRLAAEDAETGTLKNDDHSGIKNGNHS